MTPAETVKGLYPQISGAAIARDVRLRYGPHCRKQVSTLIDIVQNR
jgi:hypothetical protein